MYSVLVSIYRNMIERLEKVGFCPCFGRRKGLKLNNAEDDDEEDNDQRQVDSSQHVTVDPHSSSGQDVEQTINLDQELERSIAESNIQTKSDAQIFTYRELATATKNFRTESILGEGGFGPVYRGKLQKTGQVVAIKKLNERGIQGDKEFLVEILMLSLLRHPNLVELIGYCAEGDQRLVVYEFMPLGSLEYHLHDLEPDTEPLNWDVRMRIAYGAAKGLDYLHNDAKPQVIYRDLKSSNILIGAEYYPKLSDFGLAKFGPSDGNTHVSTRVMGTHGYCAPEYGTSGKLTKRSDVYSFGVVLLELITGRRALDETQPREKQMLVRWALPMLRDRRDFVKLADPRLKGQYPRSSVRRAVEVALMCLQEESRARPGIREVVQALEYLSSHKYEHNGSRAAETETQNMKVKSSEDIPGDIEMLNKEQERQRAVAEAKMWGETWREKRRTIFRK